jgi:hypothetical protein
VLSERDDRLDAVDARDLGDESEVDAERPLDRTDAGAARAQQDLGPGARLAATALGKLAVREADRERDEHDADGDAHDGQEAARAPVEDLADDEVPHTWSKRLGYTRPGGLSNRFSPPVARGCILDMTT